MTTLNRRNLLLGLLAASAMPAALRADVRPLPRPSGQRAVASAGDLITRAALGGEVAFAVLDAQTGQMLASRHPDLALPPASTLKTVTALYAQAMLGDGHRFVTRVLRIGDALVLAGGGDPELDTDGLATLARQAAAAEAGAGRTPPARFLVWGGALPHVARLSGRQAVHLPYNPTVSGMILNYNRVHLSWSRGDSGYRMSLEARGSRQSPRAYTVAISAANRSAPLFTYEDGGQRENWTIAQGAMGRAGSRWLPVRKPELYAGDVFQTLCRAEGLVLPNPQVTDERPNGDEIARHESRPLREILIGMMEYSNNLTAEVVGLAASGAMDLPSSAARMGEWLRGQGVAGGYHFADHSGLRPESRVTARMMAELGVQPGQRQGLIGLMRHIPLRDAQRNEIDSPIRIDAKTGTLNFVSNLAGYAREDMGRPLAFAVLTVDEARRAVSEGQELPEGAVAWNRRAKALQQALIESWTAEHGAVAVAAEPQPAPPASAGPVVFQPISGTYR